MKSHQSAFYYPSITFRDLELFAHCKYDRMHTCTFSILFPLRHHILVYHGFLVHYYRTHSCISFNKRPVAVKDIENIMVKGDTFLFNLMLKVYNYILRFGVFGTFDKLCFKKGITFFKSRLFDLISKKIATVSHVYFSTNLAN